MSFPIIYAIRIAAGLSLISALVVICMSSYVFISRLEDLDSSKFSGYGVPDNISPNKDENEKFHEMLIKMNKLWTKYRSILVSSSALAIVSGLLQATFSVLTVFGDSKVIRVYIRKWVMVHFILIFVFFIILLNTILLTENTEEDKEWNGYIKKLRYHLTQERPHTDYSNLYRFLSVGPQVMYICIGFDLPMILILMGGMLYLLRNYQDQDYEQYE